MKILLIILLLQIFVCGCRQVDQNNPSEVINKINTIYCANGSDNGFGVLSKMSSSRIMLKESAESRYFILSYVVSSWNNYEFNIPLSDSDILQLAKSIIDKDIRAEIDDSAHEDKKSRGEWCSTDTDGSGFGNKVTYKMLGLDNHRKDLSDKRASYSIKILRNSLKETSNKYPIIIRFSEHVIIYPNRPDHGGLMNYLHIHLSENEANNLSRILLEVVSKVSHKNHDAGYFKKSAAN